MEILEEIYKSGRARAIGVSNFMEKNIDALLGDAKIVPAVNQIELHPHYSSMLWRHIAQSTASPAKPGVRWGEPGGRYSKMRF